MKDIKKIPEHILRDLDQRGLSKERIENADTRTLLNQYLSWHGLFGYTDSILEAIDAFDNAEIES